MATLTYNGESYTVDRAVKGADFIHGYDANGVLIVAFDGVTDFSSFAYDDTYMDPAECLTEHCNNVVYCGGVFKKLDGTRVMRISSGTAEPSGGYPGDIYLQIL